jgi:hypothetical protein
MSVDEIRNVMYGVDAEQDQITGKKNKIMGFSFF